jgi:hypothetical protein
MLSVPNIKAAATPQIVNRFVIFIEFSSRGWIVDFALSRTTHAPPFACELNPCKEHASAKIAAF